MTVTFWILYNTLYSHSHSKKITPVEPTSVSFFFFKNCTQKPQNILSTNLHWNSGYNLTEAETSRWESSLSPSSVSKVILLLHIFSLSGEFFSQHHQLMMCSDAPSLFTPQSTSHLDILRYIICSFWDSACFKGSLCFSWVMTLTQ